MSPRRVDEQVEDAAEKIAVSLCAFWIVNKEYFPSLEGQISRLRKTVTDEEHWHLIIRKIQERQPTLAQEVANEIFNSHYFEKSPLEHWAINLCFIVFLDGALHFLTGSSLIYSSGKEIVAYDWAVWWLDFLVSYLAFGLHIVAFATGFLAIFHYIGFFKSRIKGHYYQEASSSQISKKRIAPKL